MWINYNKMTFFFGYVKGIKLRINLLLPRPDDLSDSPEVAWLKKKGLAVFSRPVGERNARSTAYKNGWNSEHDGWCVAMFGLMFD